MGKRVARGQNCLDCTKCDGFACYQFSRIGHWLDAKVCLRGGKSVRKSKKEKRYIKLFDYGRKYCRHFNRRTEKRGPTVLDYPCFVTGGGGVGITAFSKTA